MIARKLIFSLFCLLALSLTLSALAAPSAVRIAVEPLVIPTYKVGPPEPNPVFYTHEAYQGAQKHVYPYALLDNLQDGREDKTWKAVTLENEYLKIQVLPELGGRLFSAVDKTNGYDIFYHQHVIKPALIGMLGAWISGGIEWCVFHHHRNTTFMPVDTTLAENPDGSKTVWFGETERRDRMKWLIGLTLRPGSSRIEATVKFFNRTPQPHTILYWANTAVHVNDQYQVLFPPSVQMATFHSKTDFTTWPIGGGEYMGYNYKGIDVSWWKNSPVSNSFFAWHNPEDFMGGYDHGKQAGVAHVADHNVVCGAKLWEWGTGPAGKMWDKILTDTDGPYAELMVGAWSDNQPDYSWIKPGEVKTFTQCWYPIRELGGLKNANREAAMNLELKNGKALLAFNTTSARKGLKATLKAGKKVIFEETVDIAPDKPFRKEVAMPAGTKETDLRAALAEGKRELIAYQPVALKPVEELPKTVDKPARPAEVKNQEELYLQGLRVEQINKPNVDPLDYYLEGLKRDPGDTRCNIAVGTTYNKRFMFAEAEPCLRKALERLAADYTRPVSGEACYQLGLALRGQGKLKEAEDAFNRAAWDVAFRAPASIQLAELASRAGKYQLALAKLNQALETDALNTRALGLKAALLRRMGKAEQAAQVARQALKIDPLDFLAMNEAGEKELALKMRGEVQSYLELACDYLDCGLWDEAVKVLEMPVEQKTPFAASYPMIHYALGYAYAQKHGKVKAGECWKTAAAMPVDRCFPFRLEEKEILEAALKANPSDARALLYLGNLLYDNQPKLALSCWEKAVRADANLAQAHRNIGWAAYRLNNDIPKAIASTEKAVALSPQDTRLLVELDTLYELGNAPLVQRLVMLEKHPEVTLSRNESHLRELMVHVLLGDYDKVIGDLERAHFRVREGSADIHEVDADSHLLRGLARLKAGKAQDALADFKAAGAYPENLSVGKPKSDPRLPQVYYYMGSALEAMKAPDEARKVYAEAVREVKKSSPEARYYQAACLDKLGRTDEAQKLFAGLVENGRAQLAGKDADEYFVIFGEKLSQGERAAQAHYFVGLGLLGQGDKAGARAEFEQAVKLNLSHVWARYQLAELK